MSSTDQEAQCPYCAAIPGVGSSAPLGPESAFNVVLSTGPSVVVTPTVGMLTQGYLLVITTEHVLSFASLGEQRLDEVDAWLGQFIAELPDEFGDYLVFEHGSGKFVSHRSSGACITHAHLHLIPARALLEVVRDKLGTSPLASLRALAAFEAETYALVGLPGEWHVRIGADLPGQWIRRIVANHLNRADEWDWAIFPGLSELNATLDRLSHLFHEQQSPPRTVKRPAGQEVK